MNLLGREIHRCYDQWGPIRVIEQGPRRYLTFGREAEQACVNRHNPAWLVYEYTQAMSLALLYQPEPRHVTLLGLGAGSLANCLLHYDRQLEVTAVELREQVVRVAREWLFLDPDPRLSIEVADAGRYMAEAARPSDLLFADLYTDAGMVETQLDSEFLAHCHANLTEAGILVLNLWEETRGAHPLALERLINQFGPGVLICPVEDGNLIALAFKQGLPEVNPRRLHKRALKIGRALELPLPRLVNGLKPGW